MKIRKRIVVEIKGEIIVDEERSAGVRVVSIQLDEPVVVGFTARVENERGKTRHARMELRIEAARATFSPFVEAVTGPTSSLPVRDKPPTTPNTKRMRAVDEAPVPSVAPFERHDWPTPPPRLESSAPYVAPFEADDWPFDQGETTVSRPLDEITTERNE